MPGFTSSTISRTTRPSSSDCGLPWSRPTRHATTLDEAIALAVLLQKNDQLVEAGQLYQRVLDAAPDHPDALHYAGVLAHQQGRHEDAIALIEKVWRSRLIGRTATTTSVSSCNQPASGSRNRGVVNA